MFTRPGIQIYRLCVGLPDGKRMSTSHDWEYLGMVYTIPAIDIYGELGHGRHDMVLATWNWALWHCDHPWWDSLMKRSSRMEWTLLQWLGNPWHASNLVGGLEHLDYFSIYWEFHHPNWRTHIFQRGRAQPPTRNPWLYFSSKQQPVVSPNGSSYAHDLHAGAYGLWHCGQVN